MILSGLKCRWNNNRSFVPSLNQVQLQGVKLHRKWSHTASARKKAIENSALLELSEDEADAGERILSTSKKATVRRRKKSVADPPADPSESAVSSDEETVSSALIDSKKKPRKTRKKGKPP